MDFSASIEGLEKLKAAFGVTQKMLDDEINKALYASAKRVEKVYGNFIYDRRNSSSKAHTQAYTTNMSALIRDLAADYLKRRERNARRMTTV